MSEELVATDLKHGTAPGQLRHYGQKFASGEIKRWDLAAHLMEQSADLIERQSRALDAAMMVVWWMVGEGIVPSDYDIDPDQVMLDNVANIIGDNGEHWEQMFQALSPPQ